MRPIGRKPRGGGGIYVLVVVVAAVLAWMFQDRWMARKRREARSEQGVVMAPNGFADKAAHWMLRRRGLEKAEEGGGAKECPACGGRGYVRGAE